MSKEASLGCPSSGTADQLCPVLNLGPSHNTSQIILSPCALPLPILPCMNLPSQKRHLLGCAPALGYCLCLWAYWGESESLEIEGMCPYLLEASPAPSHPAPHNSPTDAQWTGPGRTNRLAEDTCSANVLTPTVEGISRIKMIGVLLEMRWLVLAQHNTMHQFISKPHRGGGRILAGSGPLVLRS